MLIVTDAHPTIAMQYGDMLEEPMLSRADTGNSIRDATPLRMHAGMLSRRCIYDSLGESFFQGLLRTVHLSSTSQSRTPMAKHYLLGGLTAVQLSKPPLAKPNALRIL